MTLSEELNWRGFAKQTTLSDISQLNNKPVTFYWGVDPSADSMTVGHLAIAMMVRHFIRNGHKAVLLVGGATGLIGDPDGKKNERDLLSSEQVARNKQKITEQYKVIFTGQTFEVVDNYDWFKGLGYLDFLRDIGKHVPMRQMLGRDFVQSRLGEGGSGISYAEFSYSLIQGYDFLHLFREKGVTLQVCGADQWGNSVTGVDLIRRIEGKEAHVWSAPLVINKATGVKFGKSEEGAIWLDPEKTTPTQFYQFWVNVDDEDVESYLKIYTYLDKNTIDGIMASHRQIPEQREAQKNLARAVTEIVHGEPEMRRAESVTEFLTGKSPIGKAGDESIKAIRKEIPVATTTELGSIIEVMIKTKLASSNSEARRLIVNNAISVNGQKITRENFEPSDFQNGRLLMRRGKAFKDSALIELG